MITDILIPVIHFIANHIALYGLVNGLIAITVGVAATLRYRYSRIERVPYPDPEQGLVRGSDGLMHGVWAGYDGECVYAWSCWCGQACSDFQSLDHATEEGAQHLIDVDALVAA